MIDIPIPTLRPASAVFGIEEPLSIFNTEFFNIDFIQYGGPMSTSRMTPPSQPALVR
jgi:hypothetical protein